MASALLEGMKSDPIRARGMVRERPMVTTVYQVSFFHSRLSVRRPARGTQNSHSRIGVVLSMARSRQLWSGSASTPRHSPRT
jgi:hypothetical protein